MHRAVFLFSLATIATITSGQVAAPGAAVRIRERGLTQLGAYSLLEELSGGIGPRLNGSEGQAKAVKWGIETMKRLGFQNVREQACMVPHWVRGNVERCSFQGETLTCCALGNSPATPVGGLSGQVIEVKTMEDAKALGSRAKGKILFFNRPFDQKFVQTMQAYGDAGDQRFSGPALGAKLGASAVLVRSLTADHDDVPHTGTTDYGNGPKVPSAALSLVAADRLSRLLRANPRAEVGLELDCETLADAPSANVMGEIRGSEFPNEVIVMGGHLDSWDKGRGAHDDGAGVVQAIEALRLIKESGIRPKRTIRVVLWANEENTGTGAEAYAAGVKASKEKHIAGIESDSGGFAPRGFSTSLKGKAARKVLSWAPILSGIEAGDIQIGGGGGADVGPLAEFGTALFGLHVESQRYFDYHHSDKDTIDKVHPRELELGAIAMGTLAWLISEKGL